MASKAGPEAGPRAGTSADTEELVDLLLGVMQLMRQHLDEVTASFELTPQQALTLRFLGDPAPMGDLASHLHCDASNVTGIADRLEERGLVERTPDPDDRRVKRLVLTDAGRELRDELLDELLGNAPVRARLSREEQRDLADLLSSVLSRE